MAEKKKKKKWNKGNRIAAAAAIALVAGGATWLSVNAATAEDPDDDMLGTAAEMDAQGEDVEVNDSGDVEKTEGEEGELVDGETDEVMFSIAVSDIAVIESCPGRIDTEVMPENGYFITFEVESSMAADMASDSGEDDVFLPLLAEAFEVLDADGESVGSGTESSWLCFEPDVLAPAFVGPGEEASGMVVLDSSVEHGSIRYAPDGQAGWTWEF